MPKYNNVNYKDLKTEVMVINRCPYCSKKFLNKNSYRNHVLNYCTMCDVSTGKSIEIGIPLNYF